MMCLPINRKGKVMITMLLAQSRPFHLNFRVLTYPQNFCQDRDIDTIHVLCLYIGEFVWI